VSEQEGARAHVEKIYVAVQPAAQSETSRRLDGNATHHILPLSAQPGRPSFFHVKVEELADGAPPQHERIDSNAHSGSQTKTHSEQLCRLHCTRMTKFNETQSCSGARHVLARMKWAIG